jgi:hypothetical protein
MVDYVLLHHAFLRWKKTFKKYIFRFIKKQNDVYGGIVESRTDQSLKNIAF